MKARVELSLACSSMEYTLEMSEGNVGTATVLAELWSAGHPETVLFLDDMNIRGTQVWIGYKDHCKQDLEKFIQCCRERDPDMIETINEQGRKGNHEYLAVRENAYRNRERLLIKREPKLTEEELNRLKERNPGLSSEQIIELLTEEE